MTVLNDSEASKDDDLLRTVKKYPKVHLRAIIGVCYVRDSNAEQYVDYLVTAAHDSLKVWLIDKDDPTLLTEKQEIKGWRSGVQDFDITPDGKMAAIVGVDSLIHAISLSLFDSSHTTKIFEIGFMEQWYVKISPSRNHYLTVSFSGFLSQLSLDGSIEDGFNFPGARQLSSLSYSPDGKTVAVANNEGIVTILNAPKLQMRFFFEAHAVKVRAICFSLSSDSLLTGSDDKIVKLYIIGMDKAELVKSFCGHRSCITAVRFHPRDPKTFASSSNDGCVILWNIAQERPICIFKDAHEGVVKSLSFSLDGLYIASVGEDRAISIHRLGNQSAAEFVANEWTASIQGSESNQQQGYSATVANGNFTTDFLQEKFRKKTDGDEEEDELLKRARRDLEGISDEERSPL